MVIDRMGVPLPGQRETVIQAMAAGNDLMMIKDVFISILLFLKILLGGCARQSNEACCWKKISLNRRIAFAG